MSKRNSGLLLFDIYVAILKIQKHANKFSKPQELLHSYVDWDVVIREFEIIGEATNALIKYSYFDESKRVIVDFRNVLIHEYFGIDCVEVWDIITNYLPSFKQEIEEKILQLSHESFHGLLENIIQENSHISYIVKNLQNLKEKYIFI
ncbi:hypothetical protein NitYY0826_C0933 [Nitratiruptor sp. YY08-26]|uniref:HepT-like ribonuclease domain-containing protein n=1 Tax=unclassified Nitratiruptor TaxID=2624044 RepID=UPI0019163D49|nr:MULTISPECIES: HepT-like ribonuclease domain-containing protein [unclassified Nitratiruptor]BCD62064.1 hypothetical protein NitYY0813_C0931 [Nitratiruptor sp. YY08-13]BCD66000.1 hypothetical protein NitYY0826_C0933 [Nitratiruptor sp. YY08-26]